MKQIYRAIFCLCNAAMTRLVKGAELSVTDSIDLYSKGGNSTGDLASGKSSTVLLGRGREKMFSQTSPPLTEENVEYIGSPTESSPAIKTPKERVHELLYSQITTLDFSNIIEMETQLRDLEFKQTFRLPSHETITDQESPCYLYVNPMVLLNVALKTPCGTLFFGVDVLYVSNMISFFVLGLRYRIKKLHHPFHFFRTYSHYSHHPSSRHHHNRIHFYSLTAGKWSLISSYHLHT
jgi:hypothetical protein